EPHEPEYRDGMALAGTSAEEIAAPPSEVDRSLERTAAEPAADATLAEAESSPRRKPWERVSGLVLAALVMLMLWALSAAGLSVPSSPFLLIAIVYTAFAGGLFYGLLSAAGSIAYFAYTASLPGAPLDFPHQGGQALAALLIVAPGMVFLVDWMRRELDGLLARERAARAAAEAAEGRLRGFIASVNDVVFTLDTSQRFTTVLGRGPSPFRARPEPLVGRCLREVLGEDGAHAQDRKSTRLNSSHVKISYAVFCLKK